MRRSLWGILLLFSVHSHAQTAVPELSRLDQLTRELYANLDDLLVGSSKCGGSLSPGKVYAQNKIQELKGMIGYARLAMECRFVSSPACKNNQSVPQSEKQLRETFQIKLVPNTSGYKMAKDFFSPTDEYKECKYTGLFEAIVQKGRTFESEFLMLKGKIPVGVPPTPYKESHERIRSVPYKNATS